MSGYKQPYPQISRQADKFQTPLPDAQDGLSFNERRLDSARTTTHVADIASNMNTESRQGMSKHNLNQQNMGTTTRAENRPQTGGSVYPNTTAISARNPQFKKRGNQ
jgi:hypothetical protein